MNYPGITESICVPLLTLHIILNVLGISLAFPPVFPQVLPPVFLYELYLHYHQCPLIKPIFMIITIPL